MDMQKYYIDGYNLTIEDIISAVKGELGTVCISPEAVKRCESSRNQIRKWLERDAPVVYGVNTGLGNLKDTALSPEDHREWNKTIPYPHAVGLGAVIDPDITRASLLIRANVLCRGYSAVRPELIRRMLDIFNKGISPVVLELGSTGLSDLGPLAQNAMVVAGLEEAEAFYQGERKKAKECFKEAGLVPVFPLECKEVLAQMNGSTMTQAIAVFACYNMRRLMNLQKEIEKSFDVDEKYQVDSKKKVYSAIERSFEYISGIVDFENNVSCDNPLLFEVSDGNYEPVMGCNCSNTQVGFVLDLLNVLISEKAVFIYEMICRSGSEKYAARKQRMFAASLVREIKALCLPASADSIPTKGNQEDHVEFSYGAARKAMKAVKQYKLLIACLIDTLSDDGTGRGNESESGTLQDIRKQLDSMKMGLA
ncbi:MAG TPA: aromatic amino acid ammonia-lyase [Clostridia bacterium]|nr:aromatic amino acid ammonia-lyase [Clostridia bacterium]